jgi:hypothetical protein
MGRFLAAAPRQVSPFDQMVRAEVSRLQTRASQAVRRVRELTGLRLSDSTRLVDSLQR